MWQGKTLSVVLPTYNEKDSIADIASRFEALEIVDEVTESSRGRRLASVPLNVEALLQRAIDDRRVDGVLAAAWLAEGLPTEWPTRRVQA